MIKALVILGLVFCASAALTGRWAHLNLALAQLKQTNYGETLAQTIELELSLQEDPRPIIIQLLTDLKNDVEGEQARADEEIAAKRDHCNTVIPDLEQRIATLKSQIAADTTEQNQKTQELDDVSQQLETEEALLENLQTTLNEATQAREAFYAQYQQKAKKLRKLLNVLTEVRAYINERIEARNTEASPSFLEKKPLEFFAQIRQRATTELADSQGWGKMINFLTTKAETHLRDDPNEIAVSGLQRVVGIIDGLLDKFEQEQAANIKANEEDLAIYTQLKNDLEPKITASQGKVANLAAKKSSLQSRLEILAVNLKENGEKLEQRETQLEEERDSCEAAERSYAESTARRTEDLEVINQVLDIFRNDLQGLSERNEEFIRQTEIPDEYKQQ